MNVCPDCATLLGQPAERQPHAHLHLNGSGVFGTPSHPVAHYLQYRRDACGAWLHCNTLTASPPERWTLAPGTIAENLMNTI